MGSMPNTIWPNQSWPNQPPAASAPVVIENSVNVTAKAGGTSNVTARVGPGSFVTSAVGQTLEMED